MKALRFVCWLIVFLIIYGAFFVFFQYGPAHFVSGAREQLKLTGAVK